VWDLSRHNSWREVLSQAEAGPPLVASGEYQFSQLTPVASGISTIVVDRANPRSGSVTRLATVNAPTRTAALGGEQQTEFDGAVFILVNARLYRVAL
jgi:hypothetical protein